MNVKLLLATSFALGIISCNTNKNTNTTMNNIFFEESTLPYAAPDFSKISTADYMPAFEQGMKEQNERIDSIVTNTESPTFENTILALEKSSEILNRVSNVFFALTSSHTNDEIKALQEKLSPILSQHKDNIYLNKSLFDKIKQVYDSRENLGIDEEATKLIEEYYKDFSKAGANLSEEEKVKLKEINSTLATLQTQFNQTLLAANNAGAIEVSEQELEGLSDSQKKSLKNKDTDGYAISLLNTTQQPLLQSLNNRELREQLFKASIYRTDQGEHSTTNLVTQIAQLRAEKAALLGFPNYASWSMQGTMAKDPEKVLEFFTQLITAANNKAKQEAYDIQQMIYDSGEHFELMPWDWNRYAEKVRKEKYDLNEEELKPYFEMKTVLEKGVFYAAERLYGITYKQRTDIPTYHEDVMVYELFEEDGTELGLFYADFFARPSKRGGAWMSNFVTQSKLYNKKPVIYNVCNYTKPAEGEPALLTYDEVETMFHEFGHALHGFFADQTYPSLSGTAVARDFVEFPSQVNENWALHPEILANYAIHYESGETIPTTLIEKIKNASTFNQGYSLVELLAAANLDLQWHMIASDEELPGVEHFEKHALGDKNLNEVEAIFPRYKSTYFAHVFGGGYGAGYYSYIWTEMLHHDAYQWFETNGGLSRTNGQRFRDMVLSRGNTQELETMYTNWRRGQPTIEPMIKARGLR